MTFDENEFFREATLCICSSLDPEIFLWETFKYIKNFFPVDGISLTYQYPERNFHFVLANATEQGGLFLNIAVKATEEGRRELDRTHVETRIMDRAKDHPQIRPWIKEGFIDENASMLSLRLISGSVDLGAVVLMCREPYSYTKKHAERLTLLKRPFSIALSNSLRYRNLVELKEHLAEDNRFLRNELLQETGETVIGADSGLKGVMEMVRQVAPLPSPVLLLGETGTGKEIIANTIHRLSPRRNGPFIKINCGAIPENLVDSELFGHEKGAFTGALSKKLGRFERADQGTIFLDEIGELQPDVQVRLLRILQDKKLERVGGTEPVEVDIRIIAATHRKLDEMVKENDFREDLYFRIMVFPILIPPLRDRKSDIALLVQHFIISKYRGIGLTDMPVLAPEALNQCASYNWPGNVRELENVVERALILNGGEPLSFPELDGTPGDLLSGNEKNLEAENSSSPLNGLASKRHPALDEMVKNHIQDTMKMTGGRVEGEKGAAKLLKLNPATLRKKMKKLGIPFGRKTKW